METPREYHFARIDSTLVTRRAGTSARAEAQRLKPQSLFRTFFQEVTKSHAADSNWRKGAEGEELVAARLRKLSQGWYSFHDIILPGDANGDHIVVGPGGVFSPNAKT